MPVERGLRRAERIGRDDMDAEARRQCDQPLAHAREERAVARQGAVVVQHEVVEPQGRVTGYGDFNHVCLAILLLGARGEGVPLGVAERLQPGELTGALEPFAAVDHDALAVDVRRAVRDEVRGQVGQLLMPADAFQRDAVERDLPSSGLGISRSHAPGVGKGPGAMAFSVMPYFAHSTASERVSASTPALAAADGTT